MNEIKGMPYNLEAEQSLLGCMLMDNEILFEVLGTLSDKDFYAESHQYIISAIKRVYADRKPLDIITLTDELEKTGTLGSVGGIAYVTELAQLTPSAANYKTYYEIVKRDSVNRSMIRAAREITEFAQNCNEADETIRFAEERLYTVTQAQETSSMENIRETGFYDVLERFNAYETDKNAFRGVMTGFFRLDKLTNGFQKSNLIVLAARPGMGKTSLAMNIIEHAALYDNKVCAVFSLEMSNIELKERLLCSAAGVSMAEAKAGKLKGDEWKRLMKFNEKLTHNAKLNIDENSRVTPAEILSKCRRIKAQNGGRLDLVMIDYIQLMTSGRSNTENRTQEVSIISRELKLIAKELKVPIIALSQLKRLTNGEKQPQLSDLRESGSIEQDADIVMFIERPDVGATDEELQKKQIVKGMAYLNIAKNRHGGLAKLPLRFRGDMVKFVDAEKE